MNAIELLLDLPRRNAERTFLIEAGTGQSLTYAGLHQAAVRVAADLRRRGLQRGDRIAILLHNSADFAKLYFGCLYAGLVTVPVNPVLAHKEIDYLLTHSGAKLLVLSPETLGQVDLSALSQTGLPLLLLVPADATPATVPSGATAWRLSDLPPADDFVPLEGAAPDDILTIVYTSGTTAQPSGVIHRVKDLIDNARLYNRRLGIGPDNRFYGILAMTYLGGYYNLLLLPYVAEASVVLSNAFDARSALNFWQAAREHGVNTLWLVPTIMSILLEMDRGAGGETFCREHVRLALVGTAPLPLQLRRDFEKRYGITLYENYALSETLFICTNAPAQPLLDGSVGYLLPGVQLTIAGLDDQPAAYGDEGEILVSTPYLMVGYHAPEAAEPRLNLRGEWFPTGDIGLMTPTGNIHITGRKKDLIIRGGLNISPAAIENVLYEHPAVAECAVVGIPHAMYGEDIAAVVRLAPGYEFAKVRPELLALCRANLGSTRQPAQLLEIEAFPRSSSGKIQKVKVRELLTHKLGLSPQPAGGQPAASAAPAPAPMLPGRVRRSIPRPAPELIEQLKQYPTSLISDCLNRLGVLDGAVHSLAPGRSCCGPAVTVEEVEGGNLMSHAALELLQPGDVLVIDAKGVTTRACWGGLQTHMAQARGAVGLVINGTVRDYDVVVQSGLPVFALGVSPGGPLKGWGGNVNLPIACAGVAIAPGDIVVGDDDGVVVIPHDLAERLPALCAQRAALEQGWFERIDAGEATLDVVGLRKKLTEYGIQFE